jgi:hypothetical protein
MNNQDFVIGGDRPRGVNFELLLVGYYEQEKFMFAGKVRQGLRPTNPRSGLQNDQTLTKKRMPFCHFVEEQV